MVLIVSIINEYFTFQCFLFLKKIKTNDTPSSPPDKSTIIYEKRSDSNKKSKINSS